MVQADWLATILETSSCEIYIVDCASLNVIALNQAARLNLQLGPEHPVALRLPDLARLGDAEARALLAGCETPGPNGGGVTLEHETVHLRRDGSSYPVSLRIRRCTPGRNGAGHDEKKAQDRVHDDHPVYIVIGQDLSARRKTERALRLSDSRFRAIVSNTPGLVYQFVLRADGSIAFPYLSEGCNALLGVGADLLQRDATRFLALILADDRASYLAAMAASAADKTGWNWEGRIWIEEWKDIKWINLRATPRDLADGGVQWEGIMTNITQSKLEEAEIKRSRAQLAELSAHVESVKEQERTRIAREIHDDLGGNLTAIKMSLALLSRRLPPDLQLSDKTGYLVSLVDRTIESIHRISGDLRPSILDFGLVAAIDWQAKEFERLLGIGCAFQSNRKDIRLDPEQATALFRIFQEALTNISKHAQATQVRVELVRGPRNVRLQIEDNGIGIANADRLKPKSFGIRGMVERASALGGTLAVTGGAGGGSVVSVRVPIAAPGSAASIAATSSTSSTSPISPTPSTGAAALTGSPAATSAPGPTRKTASRSAGRVRPADRIKTS